MESVTLSIGAAFWVVDCSQSRGKEGVATRRELLSAIRLGCFGPEPARREFFAQSPNIEQPHSMDLMAAPVGLADAAKGFYAPNQGSLSLILCCLDQYGPIIT